MGSLNETANSDRLHIGFFGCRNAGKSSVVNAVTNQELAVVSDVKGTTTDPVQKAMELLPLGPVVIIDTPGFDDDDKLLGEKRVERAKKILNKSDIAILVVSAVEGINKYDEELMRQDLETYGVLPYEVFADYVTDEQYYLFNGHYLAVPIGKGYFTLEELMEVIKHFLPGNT